jgi:hypothetical protein
VKKGIMMYLLLNWLNDKVLDVGILLFRFIKIKTFPPPEKD